MSISEPEDMSAFEVYDLIRQMLDLELDPDPERTFERIQASIARIENPDRSIRIVTSSDEDEDNGEALGNLSEQFDNQNTYTVLVRLLQGPFRNLLDGDEQEEEAEFSDSENSVSSNDFSSDEENSDSDSSV